MNELPPNWLHQTLESSKAMNTQDQIRLLAEKAQANACDERGVSHDCELGRLVFKYVLAALTALTTQQTADAAAHREVVDTFIRNVIGKFVEARNHDEKGNAHVDAKEMIAAAAHYDEADKLREEGLALTTHQTADAAAHREEVERLTKERDFYKVKVEQVQQVGWDISEERNALMAERDTAHAESAKLREVLEKLSRYDEEPIWWDDRGDEADSMRDLASEALAEPVLNPNPL